MTSALIDKWLPHRQTNDTRTDACVCGMHSCVRASVICRRVAKWKKIACGTKKNRTSIDNPVPTVVTLHCFSCLTLNPIFVMALIVRKAKTRLTFKVRCWTMKRLELPKVKHAYPICVWNLSQTSLEFVAPKVVRLVFVTFSVIYVCFLSRSWWVFVTRLFGFCHERAFLSFVFQSVRANHIIIYCFIK